jgi:hypothetical protein
MISKSSNLLEEFHSATQTTEFIMQLPENQKPQLGLLDLIGLSIIKCVTVLKELGVQKGYLI